LKQIRATIPTHLQAAFLEVGKQLNTADPTVINTHILSCYFTGDRSESPKKTHVVETIHGFDDLADWVEEEL